MFDIFSADMSVVQDRGAKIRRRRWLRREKKKGKWELKSVFLVDTEADSASISRGAVYSANSRQKSDSIKCMIIIVHKCEKLRNPVAAERDSVR